MINLDDIRQDIFDIETVPKVLYVYRGDTFEVDLDLTISSSELNTVVLNCDGLPEAIPLTLLESTTISSKWNFVLTKTLTLILTPKNHNFTIMIVKTDGTELILYKGIMNVNNRVYSNYSNNYYVATLLKQTVPTILDNDYLIGTMWVNVLTNRVYFLTSVVNDEANWLDYSDQVYRIDQLEATRELLENKAEDFTTINQTKYPTVQAVKTELDKKVDTLLTIVGLDLQDNISIEEFRNALGNATQSVAGLLSPEDKTRLDVLHALLEEDTENNVVDTIDEILSIFNNYPEGVELVTVLQGKVDKVIGKELSTNDYTNTDKNKVNTIDQIYTSAEKTKLSGIETGAEVNEVNSVNGKQSVVVLNQDDIGDGTTYKQVSQAEKNTWNNKQDELIAGLNISIVGNTISASGGGEGTQDITAEQVKTLYEANEDTNAFTDTEKNKLSGIETGAEVNVQSDWTQEVNTADDYIKNKPVIPTKISHLTNDTGYITGYTETDPIFTAWNKSTGISITKSQVSDLITATQALSGLMSATDKQRLDVLHALLEEDTSNSVVDSINEVLAIFNNYPEGADLVTALAGKVDKATGKGLSTNDLTNTLKSNYDTAYGWGNHATENYLKSITKAMVEGVLTGTITSHNHNGVYEPANSNIQSHISSTSNPHSVTKSQVELGSVLNYGIATQLEAETGTSNVKYMTPLRTKEAILELSPPTDLTDLNNHMNDVNNPHNVSKSQVGLGNVDNTSDLDKPISTSQQTALDNKSNLGHAHIKSDITDFEHTHDDRYYTESETNILLNAKLDTSLKGAADGLAELDSDGKVPSSQLPSYVDDVLEYTSFSSFPSTGESSKIYISQDTNKTYRWSGSGYTEISASLALGETSSTAGRGDWTKTAYDHTSLTNNPHNVTKAQIELDNVDNTSDLSKPISTAQQTALDTKVDKVTGKGLSTNDYTTTEKNKLAGIASGAEVNVQSNWNAISGDALILNKPTIPTKISDLTNDKGYITEYTETDPIFTAWNKSTGISITKSQITDFEHTHDDRYYTKNETDTEISTAVSELVDSSPATLDTLNELAAALGNDPNFATTVATEIGKKVTANTAITGATKTKITYDSKGLVTSGADAGIADISGLQSALSGKVDKVTGKGLTKNEFTDAYKDKVDNQLTIGNLATQAYPGDKGKIAYDHSLDPHAPSNAEKNSDITKAEIEAKLTGTITSHSHALPTHTHDNRYYTETEVNTLLSGKSDSGHGHAASEITESTTKQFVSNTEKAKIAKIDITENLSLALDSKAPKSHAGTSSAYGLGTTVDYGHVQVRNDLLQSGYVNGVALSAYQGRVLKNGLDAVTDQLDSKSFKVLTTAQYNALSTKDTNTIYFIV